MACLPGSSTRTALCLLSRCSITTVNSYFYIIQLPVDRRVKYTDSIGTHRPWIRDATSCSFQGKTSRIYMRGMRLKRVLEVVDVGCNSKNSMFA
ncbi:hypothetical protein FA13DRAFT_1033931 [Coprinellus micaceus]|uniref:Uncharacterized protein n=1 Tax=Coprinellus micaceus TaxID=71717 RepID=A0A4Y7RN06_COPMI|nr:hypothetical protein FA13DRAFT_1033931 [Coprinellus micaceus]